MKSMKFFLTCLAFSFLISDVSIAGGAPTDSEAMTCNVIFQLTKATAKDPKTVADADKAANLFGAYLIKNGMKEPDFIALYDKTVKKVQDMLANGSEDAWGKRVDECADFADDI